MKKGLYIILAIIICFVIYFFVARKKENLGGTKENPLSISKNSDTFNHALQSVLKTYYQLHDALVDWDSIPMIDSIGNGLSVAVNDIPFGELKADSLLVNTAKNYASAVNAECIAMQKEPDIKEQRKSFYTISENLFDLLRTVQYDKATIYHVRCPMAFGEDQEGYWLSDKREVINPYYGDKDPKQGAAMLHCGSVEDSISFK